MKSPVNQSAKKFYEQSFGWLESALRALITLYNQSFWRLYFVASIITVGLSLLLFKMITYEWPCSYEEAVLFSSVMTMPLNWLIGEQLSWRSDDSRNRMTRALRYFGVYCAGLLLNVLVVHHLGHELRWPGHLSAAIGAIVSIGFTAPLNRYWTWESCSGLRSNASSAGAEPATFSNRLEKRKKNNRC